MIAAVGTARADCATEAAELRHQLAIESHRAHRWNGSWGVAFAAASIGQLALAVGNVGNTDQHEAFYVGAAKAGLGAASHLVVPLAIDVPAAVDDPCADRTALEGALAVAKKKERSIFYLGHFGALAVNLAGVIVLAERRSLLVGLESFAVGYPVGLLSIYTAPRAAWHLTVTPSGVALAGEW